MLIERLPIAGRALALVKGVRVDQFLRVSVAVVSPKRFADGTTERIVFGRGECGKFYDAPAGGIAGENAPPEVILVPAGHNDYHATSRFAARVNVGEISVPDFVADQQAFGGFPALNRIVDYYAVVNENPVCEKALGSFNLDVEDLC